MVIILLPFHGCDPWPVLYILFWVNISCFQIFSFLFKQGTFEGHGLWTAVSNRAFSFPCGWAGKLNNKFWLIRPPK